MDDIADLFEQLQGNPNFIFDDDDDDAFFADMNFNINNKKMKLSSISGGEAKQVSGAGAPIQISFGEPSSSSDPILPAAAPRLTSKTISLNSSEQRILSERKRREKLSESFISLSSLIPDLKKMDKGSIMEDAIKYLKQLKDSVESLENKIAEGNSEEEEDNNINCTVYTSSTKLKENVGNNNNNNIKAILSGKSILIQIHCDKKMGVEAMILNEISRLRLTLVSSSFMQFGHNHTEITLVTEMKADFNVTMEDLVKILQFNVFQSQGQDMTIAFS